MIRQCFSLFDGVGPKREQAIRAAGISHWQDFLDSGGVPGVSDRLYGSVAQQIRKWSAALDQPNLSFLADAVPRAGHWTLFDELRDSVRYLDIETTGLSPGHHHVTVVGLYDGQQYQALVRGQGLSAEALREALTGCKLLISYYGTVFDVPFLRVAFPQVNWNLPHFDLCFAGRKVGLTGGLKMVERTLGIARGNAIAEVDGFEAVRLWRAYERGNPKALTRLVDYNEADTRNLAQIAAIVYDRLCGKHGL